MQIENNNSSPSVLVATIVSIKYWTSRIVKKWMLVLLVSVLGAATGIVYAWLQKPIYTAEMSFASETDGQGKMGGYASLAAQFGFDIGGGGNTFEGENLVDFFKSKFLIERTLYTQVSFVPNKPVTLIEQYLRNRITNDQWLKDTVLKNISFTQNIDKPYRHRDSIVQKVSNGVLKECLKVEKRDKKLVIIDASFMDSDEKFAKVFLETLASNAISFYVEYKSAKARANVNLLEKQVDSLSNILTGNIVQVAVNNDVNINPTKQISRTNNQRRQIDIQANGAAYSELLKQLAIAKLNLKKEMPLIQIIDNAKYPLLKKKPGRLLTGIKFGLLFSVMCVFFIVAADILKGALGSAKQHGVGN